MRKAVYADVQLTGADSSVLTRILKKKKDLKSTGILRMIWGMVIAFENHTFGKLSS